MAVRLQGEAQFHVPVGDGLLVGHRRDGDGPPALVLHGGAAVPDYMSECARELADLFATIRYTQRGTPPSIAGPPYSIEQHMADAVAVLDFFGAERAWVVGHSWGGHLALHLLCAHPERVAGAVCIDPLGARPEVFREADANLRCGLAPEVVERIDEIEQLRRQGRVTEDELVERFRLVWPQYFGDRTARSAAPPERVGVESSIGTNASISDHFARGTLVEKLPAVSVPVLFVHGELDPMPPASSFQTAALIPAARVETIAACGHFPWWERPGEIRRLVGLFLTMQT
jgi:proline iminopeptidase